MARTRDYVALLTVSVSTLITSRADAASLRPSIVTGMMQQPSSQYYHYVYGGQLDLARKEDAAYMRLQYIERPAFRHGGYVDQDFSGGLLFGARVLKYKDYGVSALMGAGYAWGYLKEEAVENPARESYRMPGIATGIEARWAGKWLDVRLAHQLMICQNDREQVEAYVAWPFTWFLLSASTPIKWGER